MSQPPQYPDYPSGPEGGSPDPAPYPEPSGDQDGGTAQFPTGDYGAPGYPPPPPPPPPGFPSQPPGYPPPPSDYQPQQSGYPAPPPGYAPPPPGYQPQQPGYQSPQPGYQPQQPGYQSPPPGYPSPAPGYLPPGYGPQQSGYPAPPPGYAPPPPAGPPGSGGYPPPPGYGPPGYQGGFPPPPGYPAPGYPQPGFGGPVGPQFDVGEALSWAWNKFSKNAGALILATLSFAAVMVVLYLVLVFGLLGAPTSGEPEVMDTGQLVLLFLISIPLAAFGVFIHAAFVSGCLDIADGKPVTIGSFFKPRNFGTVILTALLQGLLIGVGYLLCIIPGIIVGFLVQFAIAFAIDRGLSPVDALKASFETCRNNVGGALLSALVQAAVLFVGWLLCGVGSLVAVPVALLIQVYTYRRLSGGWVAPIQP